MSNESPIYRRYLEACSPAQLPERWRGLAASDHCVFCPEDGAATLATLTSEFALQDLMQTGVAQQSAEAIVLNPLLSGGHRVVRLGELPVDPLGILTAEGTLPDGLATVALYVRELRSRRAREGAAAVLFVSFELADVQILRSLGLNAVAATGLRERPADYKTFAAACGWTGVALATEESQAERAAVASAQDATRCDVDAAAPNDATSVAAVAEDGALDQACHAAEPEPEQEQELCAAEIASELPRPTSALPPLSLVLVGWSLARLSLAENAQLLRTAGWLLQFEKILGWDMTGVAIWSPSAEELTAIEFCLVHDELLALAEVVGQSVDQSLVPLASFAGATSLARDSGAYLPALRRLRAIQSKAGPNNRTPELVEAERELLAAIEHELIEPILATARAQSDPLVQNTHVAIASVAREFHQLTAHGKEPLKQRVSGMVHLADCFVRLSRELRV